MDGKDSGIEAIARLGAKTRAHKRTKTRVQTLCLFPGVEIPYNREEKSSISSSTSSSFSSSSSPPSSYASCLSRASTYENYNFPDSTKVSWLSCRGRVLSLFRPFRTDLSRNPTWFTLLRLVAAQPSRDRSLTIVSLWKWARGDRYEITRYI